jgi:hypothetical protein
MAGLAASMSAVPPMTSAAASMPKIHGPNWNHCGCSCRAAGPRAGRRPGRMRACSCRACQFLAFSDGIRESYYASVTAVAVLLLASGMFGLLVAAGSYLRPSRVGEAGIRSRSRALTVAWGIGAAGKRSGGR